MTKCGEPGCSQEARHKLKTITDGIVIYVCDEHRKNWHRVKEIPPLKTRIIKNKFKLVALTVLLIATVIWPIYLYSSMILRILLLVAWMSFIEFAILTRSERKKPEE